MTNKNEEISKLSKKFEKWQKLLIALGDENRQHLMIEMMRMEHCGGARVIEIAKKQIYLVLPFHIISKF